MGGWEREGREVDFEDKCLFFFLHPHSNFHKEVVAVGGDGFLTGQIPLK